MATSETMRQATQMSPLKFALLQVLLGVVTPLLLLSIGGAGIYAAPALLPLLWLTANVSKGRVRWYFILLTSLSAAETAWAIMWRLAPGLSAVLPLIAALGVGALMVRIGRRGLRRPSLIVIIASLAAFGAAGALSITGEQASGTKAPVEQRSP